MILLAAVIWLINQEPETAVLVDSGRELTSNDTGQIRVSVNTSVNIKDGTMQDLFFSNYNEDRLLQCKIKVDDKYVYESQLIDSGKTIQAIESQCYDNILGETFSFKGEDFFYASDHGFVLTTFTIRK